MNDLELYYEVAGNPEHPPVLLIAGLGSQLTTWPSYFIAALVEAGLFVIIYDNRDIGLSTELEGPTNPHVVMEAMLSGTAPDVAYTLADMAADAAGLLDALEIDSAHIVGLSMGGMIAQLVAINHRAKARSLTSIMSTTGASDVGQPTPEAIEALLTPGPVGDRAAAIAHNVSTAKLWASPAHFDAQRLHNIFNTAWDRAGGPQTLNTARHFCAIIASHPRDERLAELDLPTLVVHGTEDKLVTLSGGERTASLIEGAELMIVEGLGHDLPPAFAVPIAEAIGGLVSTAP